MLAFTFSLEKNLTKSIILLDGVTGEVQKFDFKILNFFYTRTVVVKKELYTFKYGRPVSAYKIADFTRKKCKFTTLSTLPRTEILQYFAVSYWPAAGSIILTGGHDSRYEVTAQTFQMAVQTGRWEQRWFPALNVARSSHASMTLGLQCYVACVCGQYGGYLSSMEMLRMGVQAWELIAIPELTPRWLPIFSQIDANNIAILDGYGEDYGSLSDGVVLNAETGAVVKMIAPANEIKLVCVGQSFMKS